VHVQLIPLEGGEPLEVPEGLTVVGRDPQCDLRLLPPFVSKVHCALIKFERCLLVRDLNSSNGTCVNRQRVREKALRGGDVRDLGGARFRVATDDGCRPDVGGSGPDRSQERHTEGIRH